MSTRTGSLEHITKGLSFCGDREVHIYFALVQIAGHDTYEVRLNELRKCLGIKHLSSKKAHILNTNRPENITFTGDHDGDLQISKESAKEWADKVMGLV